MTIYKNAYTLVTESPENTKYIHLFLNMKLVFKTRYNSNYHLLRALYLDKNNKTIKIETFDNTYYNTKAYDDECETDFGTVEIKNKVYKFDADGETKMYSKDNGEILNLENDKLI